MAVTVRNNRAHLYFPSVWARHHDPSPWQSPELKPQQQAETWPKASGGADDKCLPQPSSLALAQQSPAQEEHPPLSRTSSSSSNPHQAHGLGRFWAFTLPRMQKPAAKTEQGLSRDTVFRRGAQQSNDKDSSSSIDEPVHHDGQRRSSFGHTYHSALSDALASLAAGTYMGSQSNRKATKSARSSHDENRDKAVRQADDEEKQMTSAHDETRDWSHDPSHDAEQEYRRRLVQPGIAQDNSFSRHQPLTPGWESPWRPESRRSHSIRFGNYRFTDHGGAGYFPRTDTGSGSRRRMKLSATDGRANGGVLAIFTVAWWRYFLLHNAFVPLLFRLLNIAFTTSTLAIAIRLYRLLRQEGAEDSVGSSPVVAIIFSPLTLTHVAVQIYIEYFSRPIGLWRVGNKLFYTLIEVCSMRYVHGIRLILAQLIFICLWSAELSLSFDNYFTSTLVCTTFNSPYANPHDKSGIVGPQRLNDPAKKPAICRLQGALIGLCFTSLLAYVIVFAVSGKDFVHHLLTVSSR